MITPKRKVSFPDSKQNYWKTAFLNRSKMQNRKHSVTSKAITTESDSIQESTTEAHWSMKNI